MSKVKLIVVDLDGTLLNKDGVLPTKNSDAIAKAHAAGIKVVLATGRPIFRVRRFVSELKLRSPLISLNGAIVLNADGTEIFSQPLCVDQVKLLYQSILGSRLSCRAYTRNAIFQYIDYWRLSTESVESLISDDFGDVSTVDSISEMPLSDVFKVAAIADIGQSLRDGGSSFSSQFSKFECAASLSNWLEFTDRGINKASGAKIVAAKLRVRREEVMAIGDQENDLPLIEWAGIGVFVANAPKWLQQKSDKVVPKHHLEDGVAWAIENYAIGRKSAIHNPVK